MATTVPPPGSSFDRLRMRFFDRLRMRSALGPRIASGARPSPSPGESGGAAPPGRAVGPKDGAGAAGGVGSANVDIARYPSVKEKVKRACAWSKILSRCGASPPAVSQFDPDCARVASHFGSGGLQRTPSLGETGGRRTKPAFLGGLTGRLHS